MLATALKLFSMKINDRRGKQKYIAQLMVIDLRAFKGCLGVFRRFNCFMFWHYPAHKRQIRPKYQQNRICTLCIGSYESVIVTNNS